MYDILKEIAHKFGFEYPEDKLLTLAAAVKKMVDDKSKYTDWANRSDIKAELQMDLILILAEHGYPPVPQDEVFKEIFEQAENFKKYEQEDTSSARVVSIGIINHVEADKELLKMVVNMMTMDAGTTILALVKECFNQFGEKYFAMKQKDWYQVIKAFVESTTHRYDIQPDENFRWMAAEGRGEMH